MLDSDFPFEEQMPVDEVTPDIDLHTLLQLKQYIIKNRLYKEEAIPVKEILSFKGDFLTMFKSKGMSDPIAMFHLYLNDVDNYELDEKTVKIKTADYKLLNRVIEG